MSNVTQPITFADLYASLLRRARVDANQNLNVTQGKELINTALFDMHLGNGERFPWAERAARLQTHAAYTTGTVTITRGSATLTGVSSLWNTNNTDGIKNARAGGKIVLSGDDTVYEVSTVSSDTVLTLTDNFIGTDLAAGTYTYFEDEYSLAADFLKPIDKNRFDGRGTIEIIDRRVFRSKFTRALTTGTIVACAIFDKDFSGSTTPVRRVRFYRPPAVTQYIAYSYVTSFLAVTSAGVEQTQLSGDTDEPIVPLYARHLIVLKALEHWYRDKKNDSRSEQVKAEYVEGIQRLLGDVETGAQRPSIVPRINSYARRARQPYTSGRTRTHVIGAAFDELLE